MLCTSLLDAVLLLSLLALAAPAPHPQLVPASPLSVTPYAPSLAPCPATPLVRPASSGVSTLEQAYIKQRKTKADAALATWLSKSGLKFVKPKAYPTIGLTSSGGGYRALLCGAGVHQAFDARDSNVSTSGLYQALTYEAGLSGGSWLLSSIAANNWPTISSLVDGLWAEAFEDSLLLPSRALAATAITAVTADIVAKQAAGFPPTLTDVWGRLLAYQLLYGADGGVSDHLSDLRSLSNFTSYVVPYPIITSLGVKTQDGECLPGPNATQYEFSPYEFGSWDQGVSAFASTQYLGSTLNNGKPASSTSCVTGFDNTGLVLGTSSSLFNEVCAPSDGLNTELANSSAIANFAGILNNAHQFTTRDQYAAYVNPFYNCTSSTLVSSSPELHLVDGGEALQNNPIWPFLHRSSVDVLIVNDNSADTSASYPNESTSASYPDESTSANYPNGTELITTYVQAVSAGLTRMPVNPSVDTFISQGLNVRPTFFGCNDKSKMTTVYLPNTNYTYNSGQSTAKLGYTEAETRAMIGNGVQIGSFGGSATWAACLGCGIMAKSGVTLPKTCKTCLAEFCYN